ncbi:MAG: hypothetical protein IPK03_04425 [Bacteroidetes bacterium]|nr:hypothetical protein [Bacteroidota bacterium]
MRTAFKKQFGESEFPIEYFFCPSLLQLFGDYLENHGGMCMHIATEWGIYAAVRLRSDAQIHFATVGKQASIKLADLEQMNANPDQQEWANASLRIIQSIHQRENVIQGFDIMFFNSLSHEIDVSFSPLLEVLSAYIALYPIYKNKIDRAAILSICGALNRESGIEKCMAQQGAVLSKHAYVLLFDTKKNLTQLEPINLGPYQLLLLEPIIADQLPRDIVAKRLSESAEALSVLQKNISIEYLCDAGFKDMVYLHDALLSNRAMHCIGENIKVEEAVNVLRENYIEHLGKLLTASHKSIVSDYEIFSEMHHKLVDESILIEGCAGAKMVQMGSYVFALAMVHQDAIDAFKMNIEMKFKAKMDLHLNSYSIKISDGVKRV